MTDKKIEPTQMELKIYSDRQAGLLYHKEMVKKHQDCTTATQIAKAINISQPYYSNLTSGQRNLSQCQLSEIGLRRVTICLPIEQADKLTRKLR